MRIGYTTGISIEPQVFPANRYKKRADERTRTADLIYYCESLLMRGKAIESLVRRPTAGLIRGTRRPSSAQRTPSLEKLASSLTRTMADQPFERWRDW
jgi:hypothetical protein